MGQTIILSRTDSIGDVVLTLPMAGFIKKHRPDCKLLFLGRTYTKDVVALSEHVDGFINYDEIEKLPAKEQIASFRALNADSIVHVFPTKKVAELAKKAGIALRVGTTNRVFHWLSCNKLVKLSRRKSDLHESQLNFKLLEFLSVSTDVTLSEVAGFYGFSKVPALLPEYVALIDKSKYTVILHPKSKGSAKEWGLANFEKLIAVLPTEKFQVFVSGTKQDGEQMQAFLEKNKSVVNLTGKLSLAQFIAFIKQCDALVAASTGPLHIAAALGKTAIGLFSPKRPIHPGRWAPVGTHAHYLVYDANCQTCKQGKDCNCIQQITPQQIVDLLK